MTDAMTGSRRASVRFARSQYSGFIQRQTRQEVLRLHPDYVVRRAAQAEVDGAAGDVGAHHRGILELQREQREHVAHAALLDLAARPELVQDRARLRVEAD